MTANPYPIPAVPTPFTWPKTPAALFRTITSETNLIAPPNQSAEDNIDVLVPWQEGSTSALFRTVLKRPAPHEAVFDGRVLSNGHNVASSFLRELRFFRVVATHANLVRFLGVVEGVGLILEHVDGVELKAKFVDTEPRPSAANKVAWAEGIMDALAHIHSSGLSYTDLSPWNILITPEGTPKLIDFGRTTMAGERVYPATPPFSAPEIPPFKSGEALDLALDGILCDAYSFGVLLLCFDLDRMLASVEDMPSEEEREKLQLPLFGKLVRLYLLDSSTRLHILPKHRALLAVD